jgi:superfamily II DNA/RNA helicase
MRCNSTPVLVLVDFSMAGLTAQVLVGTPQHLAACVREKGLDMEKVKFLAVDEFDACWAEFPEDMELLLVKS